jgi:hypothetical protein
MLSPEVIGYGYVNSYIALAVVVLVHVRNADRALLGYEYSSNTLLC